MPPSGFSQKAINGLLVFVKDSYERTLQKYDGKDLTEKQMLSQAVSDLESQVEKTASGLDRIISEEAITGLKEFVTTNFYDLIAEINSGKKKEGYAVQEEIAHIRTYLREFHI